MQLENIILWPLDNRLPYRLITFQPGKVNYITGATHTGKSSIWQIIDYCLGSSKLRVPVGIVRDLVEWYGIVLNTGSKRILIARKNSTIEGAFSQYMFLEGESIDIPPRPSRNMNAERNLKNLFALHLELFKANIDKDVLAEIDDQKIGVVSYRDLLILNHMMQYAMVNPSTFISDSNYISVLKLKKILPIILYPNDNNYYKFKKGLQTKVDIQIQTIGREVEILGRQMAEVYVEANKHGLVINYVDPKNAPRKSAEMYRADLVRILNANAPLKGQPSNSVDTMTVQKAFILGRITQCLVFSNILDEVNKLGEQYKLIGEEIKKIQESSRKITNEKEQLSELIGMYAKMMDLEFRQYVPVFDDKESALKFRMPSGQEINLYQLGNQQNYVGYNIAIFLSFHEIFIQQAREFILQFLVIDHPSQTFDEGNKDETNRKSARLSEAFETAAKRMNGHFQLIVLERSLPIDLENYPNSIQVENWTSQDVDTLIPLNWKNNSHESR